MQNKGGQRRDLRWYQRGREIQGGKRTSETVSKREKVKKRKKQRRDGGNWCFMPSYQLRLYHGKATSLVNRCPMQRKNSVPDMRTEPRTSNPHCVGDALTVASPDLSERERKKTHTGKKLWKKKKTMFPLLNMNMSCQVRDGKPRVQVSNKLIWR